jgi:hypothetical protein
MKKTSIEMFLLLSDVYGKKQLSDFVTDAKSLEADQLETVLSRLDDQKTQTLSVVVDAIGAELEKKKEITGTADEVLHLLLTSYKLKVAVAAERLSEQLALQGYQSQLAGKPTKPNFAKWLRQLCANVPREKVMDVALNLRPLPEG